LLSNYSLLDARMAGQTVKKCSGGAF